MPCTAERKYAVATPAMPAPQTTASATDLPMSFARCLRRWRRRAELTPRLGDRGRRGEILRGDREGHGPRAAAAPEHFESRVEALRRWLACSGIGCLLRAEPRLEARAITDEVRRQPLGDGRRR